MISGSALVGLENAFSLITVFGGVDVEKRIGNTIEINLLNPVISGEEIDFPYPLINQLVTQLCPQFNGP